MSVTEIKETKSNLIAWIEELSDINMLSILDGIRNSNVGGDWWDDLSEMQKREINEGITDAEAGRVITSDEFWKNLKNG